MFVNCDEVESKFWFGSANEPEQVLTTLVAEKRIEAIASGNFYSLILRLFEVYSIPSKNNLYSFGSTDELFAEQVD